MVTMAKTQADTTAASSAANGAEGDQAHAEPPAASTGWSTPDDMVTKVATVGVIGVAAALVEVALVPGIIIGIGAMLVPSVLPKIADGVQPAFRSIVRGAYHVGQRARHAFAEAQEQVHDIVAEADAEKAAKVMDGAAQPSVA
jgi:hypothetical protein